MIPFSQKRNKLWPKIKSKLHLLSLYLNFVLHTRSLKMSRYDGIVMSTNKWLIWMIKRIKSISFIFTFKNFSLIKNINFHLPLKQIQLNHFLRQHLFQTNNQRESIIQIWLVFSEIPTWSNFRNSDAFNVHKFQFFLLKY